MAAAHAADDVRAARLRRFAATSADPAVGAPAAASAVASAAAPAVAPVAAPASVTPGGVAEGVDGAIPLPVVLEARTLRLGLIADVQYADADDGSDFSGKHMRHFRNTLRVLDRAVERWNAEGVDAVVQLGDLIDGCNRRLGTSRQALDAVLASLSCLACPRRFDVLGNHELYNFPRDDLAASGLALLGPGASGGAYGSVLLGASWELLLLDCYEEALIGYPTGHPSLLKAEELMRQHNSRAITEAYDWDLGLPVEKQHFTPVNGAVSAGQVSWLRARLAAAESECRSVLVFTHIPLYLPATRPKTVAWNAEALLATLHAHRDAVVAVLAGHDHCGGYAVDEAGVHHVTLCSPLHVSPPANDCSAVLSCHEGWAHLALHGHACAESGGEWEGRPYAELVLAKGAVNHPVGAV